MNTALRAVSCGIAAGCTLLVAAACSKPTRPTAPVDAAAPLASAAPSASVGVAGFGTLGPRDNPIEDLKARTYVTEVRDDLVFAGTTAGVVAWQFHDISHPKQLATVVLPGSVSGMTLIGQLLAVSTGPTGLVLVDVSNAAQGQLIRLSEAPWNSASRGNCFSAWTARGGDPKHAYIACGTGGVALASLEDPTHPKVIKDFPVPGYVRDLAVLDTHAGIAAGRASTHRVAAAAGIAGLAVVDLPINGAPRLVAQLATQGESRALDVHGGLAYVADGPGGVRIVDLTDPTHPTELSRFDPKTTDMARGITVRDNLAFVCLGDSGLLVLDVSNPREPKRMSSIDPRRAVNRATLSGHLLFAANDAGGILVLDVAKPETLQQLFPVVASAHP